MTGISALPSSQAAALQNHALAAFSNASTRANGTTGTNSTGEAAAPPVASNQLNANSFITLLTAQLQAQDPLNPMDPDQMMGELISLNSLQELINIQQDLSGTGGGAATGGTTGAANGNATGIPALGAAQAPTQTSPQTSGQASLSGPSPSYHDVVVQRNLYPAQAPASSY